ncbi:EpsG family protein [Thiomicrorhabdus chilensis]|uniref:EpsG family protein n=1 Tax=Thiomicrorhabdus chilensis TaxID=63656 RepID=UPI0003FBA40C|nr:EpsG family protein [Thiomicrorhabdus chilensis]
MPVFNQAANCNKLSVYLNFFAVFAISIAYAFVLANIIPMDESIKDRLNYLNYAGSSEIVFLRYLSTGYLPVLMNEPLWLSINIILNQFFEPEATVRLIIFFSAFTTSFLILKSNPRYFLFLIFLLIFPQVIGKFVVHLRQGLAITIFLLAWFTLNKQLRWFLLAMTPFIHASFFFVLLLYGFTWFLEKLKLALDLRTIAVVMLGCMVVISLGVLVSFLGARQAEIYDFNSTEVSGLGFLFWLGIFAVYYSQGRSFAKKHVFAMSAIVFYLTTYFFIEVTARIFESMVIIVLLASVDLTSWRRKLFVTTLMAFVGIAWLLKLSEPWLGWGGGL